MKFLKHAAASVCAATFACVGGAQAGPIDLGFALDNSGSVGAPNWEIQTDGFAAALALLPLDGTYRVTFSSFSAGAGNALIVGPTLLSGLADLTFVQTALEDFVHVGGFTDTGAGIDLLVNAITAEAGFDANDTQLINISTDGNPLFSTSNGGAAAAEAAATLAAANALLAGFDGISAEAIGSSIDIAFLQGLVSPNAPGVVVSPGDMIPNPMLQGFVLQVDSFDDFAPAIEQKIQNIVDTPEPGALLLVAFGLLGAGFAARRSRK